MNAAETIAAFVFSPGQPRPDVNVKRPHTSTNSNEKKKSLLGVSSQNFYFIPSGGQTRISGDESFFFCFFVFCDQFFLFILLSLLLLLLLLLLFLYM